MKQPNDFNTLHKVAYYIKIPDSLTIVYIF